MSDTNTLVITEYEEPVKTSSDQVNGGLLSLTPILLIFMVLYFFLIRPQEKKRREHESFISTIKRGEEIVTHSGIFGTITKVTEGSDSVEINIAKDVDIKILKSSIADILSRKNVTTEAKEEKKPSTKKSKKA